MESAAGDLLILAPVWILTLLISLRIVMRLFALGWDIGKNMVTGMYRVGRLTTLAILRLRGTAVGRFLLPIIFLSVWALFYVNLLLPTLESFSPTAGPWALLALGIAGYLSSREAPRFWALFLGCTLVAAKLVQGLPPERLNSLHGDPFLASIEGLMLVTGSISFACHFVVGLVLQLWRRNPFFLKGSLGALLCGALLAASLAAPNLLPAGDIAFLRCLVVILAASFIYRVTCEYPESRPRRETEGLPSQCAASAPDTSSPEGCRTHLPSYWETDAALPAQYKANPAESCRKKGDRFERYVASILRYLEEPEFYVLHNLYIQTDNRSSQIDHLVIASNGIWVIESKYRTGKIIVEHGRWRVVTASGWRISMVSPVAQNYRHIKDVKKFLRTHIGDQVNEIPFHNVVCLADGVELKLEDCTESNHILTPDELLHLICETPSPTPLDPAFCVQLAAYLRPTAANLRTAAGTESDTPA